MLVGGGELHDSFGVAGGGAVAALARDRALDRHHPGDGGHTPRRPRRCCATSRGWMEGRVLVAHNASFDSRVLAQAFERAGLEWPDPPVLCTVALARKCAPLVRQRKLALLADALGIEVDVVHRALPDALTCARVLCALFPRLCAVAPTVADAVAALRASAAPRPQASRRSASGARPRTVPTSSTCPRTPASTCSATSAAGRCTWASRCLCARARGPTSARRRAGPSGPRWPTTAPRTPSWARWCWRTG